MTRKYDGQLEIDDKRGVIYFHTSDPKVTKEMGTTSILRICQLPRPIPRAPIDITHMRGATYLISFNPVGPSVEGYWRKTKQDDGSGLPYPIERHKPWKGRRAFLESLLYVQLSLRPEHYKGFSTCRICGERNGSTEYSLHKWRWPSGLMHYIQDHNVKPSDEFRKFITSCSDV